ncbi:MAG: hypothetical protein NT026_00865 [Candidatus Staskawiczbacteria bacterium]|nr:hypothetical protein [Candidatus Staskawiczbacteria bacterium]
MVELIVTIIFVLSFVGVLLILVRKIPALNTLPQNGSMGIKNHHFIAGIENRFKGVLAAFENQIYLHKLLSWVKVMTLKVETKVDHLLRKIRQKNKPV